MFESLQSITPFAKAGKVHALAVTGDHRSSAFPDLPTVAEAGVPGYAADVDRRRRTDRYAAGDRR